MTDARARLREYLEQRRELGEREFVLDSLTVEEAMRLIGSQALPSPATGAPPAPGKGFTQSSAPTPRSRPATEDWRSVVSAPEPPRAPAAPATPEGESADLTSARTIADVARAIAGCRACSLSSTAKNHVPGEGNPAAKFVVVGEAPGQTEDELGRPFVGKSGELLTKILEAIGFQRDDVFICNVLKHRPPGNRNPSPAEIVACRPFLLRQLEILEPKVILALGTFAAQTLLGTDAAISKLRGIEHRYHGIPLVATYHPAALLRNPNWKRPAWEDVQLARRVFDRP